MPGGLSRAGCSAAGGGGSSSVRNYHLVVDSTALPLETVVDVVVAAARGRGIGAR